MLKKFAVVAVIAAFFSILFFSACGGGGGEITIGAILPLTGEINNYGELIRNGMDLAVAEINENGGIDGDTLKVIYKDSQGKPEVATKVGLELINQNQVPVIVGGVSSSVSLALAPIAEDKKVVLISPVSSSPKLSGIADYFFRIYPSDTLEGYTMARTVLGYQKKSGKEYFKDVVVVAARTDYAEGVKIEFVNEFRKKGETDAVINYEPENPEFDKVVEQVFRSFAKADHDTGAIYVTGYYTDIANFLLALRKHRDFDPQMFKVFASASVYTPKFREMAKPYFKTVPGRPERYGLVFPVISFIAPDSPDEAIASFAKAYNAQYGSYPESYAAHGYDVVKLLSEVIERRGVMARDIQFGLSITKDWSGVSGQVSFDENNDVAKYPSLYGYDGEKMILFDPNYKMERKAYYDVVAWGE